MYIDSIYVTAVLVDIPKKKKQLFVEYHDMISMCISYNNKTMRILRSITIIKSIIVFFILKTVYNL